MGQGARRAIGARRLGLLAYECFFRKDMRAWSGLEDPSSVVRDILNQKLSIVVAT